MATQYTVRFSSHFTHPQCNGLQYQHSSLPNCPTSAEVPNTSPCRSSMTAALSVEHFSWYIARLNSILPSPVRIPLPSYVEADNILNTASLTIRDLFLFLVYLHFILPSQSILLSRPGLHRISATWLKTRHAHTVVACRMDRFLSSSTACSTCLTGIPTCYETVTNLPAKSSPPLI